MSQSIGQFPVSRKEQQTAGIDIQATNRYPATVPERWQLVEYRRSALRIFPGADFIFRLVVENNPAGIPCFLLRSKAFAVDSYFV